MKQWKKLLLAQSNCQRDQVLMRDREDRNLILLKFLTDFFSSSFVLFFLKSSQFNHAADGGKKQSKGMENIYYGKNIENSRKTKNQPFPFIILLNSFGFKKLI